MDAFLAWFSSLGDAGLANDNPAPSSSELQDYYPVGVLDVYSKLDSLITAHVVVNQIPGLLLSFF